MCGRGALATLLSPEDNAMECVRMAVMWGFARLLCAIGVHPSFTSHYEGGGGNIGMT